MRSKNWAALAACALCAACGNDRSSGGKGGSGLNTAPTVLAGEDVVADVGQVVELQGSAVDENGDVLTYEWEFVSQPAGSVATILGAGSLSPNFLPDVEGIYLLRFSAMDGLYTSADELSVIAFAAPVVPSNGKPVPYAGPDLTAAINGQYANDASAVMLDGTYSSDPDGDTISRYLWTVVAKPLGSLAILNDPELARPSLLMDEPGEYRVVLQVYDGDLWSRDGDLVVIHAAEASYAEPCDGAYEQSGVVGTMLAQPLEVCVTNEYGDPVEGIGVRFGISAGDGGDWLYYGFDHTEADGKAYDLWTLGTTAGPRAAHADAILYVDNFGNTSEIPAGVWNAMGISGPAVDFVVSAPDEASVDDGAEVTVSGHDLYGNPANDDDTTEVTLSATGEARFAEMASVGAVVRGGFTSEVTLRLENGEARIVLNDHIAEAVAVSHLSQVYSALEGPFPLPPPYMGELPDLVPFSFFGTPLATGDGTLTVSGRGDFGGLGLTIADAETMLEVGTVLRSAPRCSAAETTETLTVPYVDLVEMTLDGEAQFLAVNLDGFEELGCPDNDFSASLSFPGSASADLVRFLPGAPARIVLRDPEDVPAGTTMLLSAFSADQFGNPVFADSTSRFSITINQPSNAQFGEEATDGILVAGGGTQVHLRVLNGLASIEVFDDFREPVEFQLGDPVPMSMDASMAQTGVFIGPPDTVVLLSGDGQTGTVGRVLAEPLVFEVRDDRGAPVPNAVLFVAATLNDGFAVEPFVFTDHFGRASVRWVLGNTGGLNAGFATAFGSADATFTATGLAATPGFARLRMGMPPASGSDFATVIVEVLDASRNVVESDDSTEISIELFGEAVWSSLVSGSEVTGLGSQVALVKVQGGVAELELTDFMDETVQVLHYDSVGNGLTYITDGGPFVAYETDFEFDDGVLFTTVTAFGVNSWEHGTPTTRAAFSGTQAWATNLTGNYNAEEASCLELHFSMPDAATISSQVLYDLVGPDVFEIHDCDVAATFCNVLTSRSGSNGIYEEMSFDLSHHAGQSRLIRWCLDSHLSPGDGIIVDDVRITGTSPELMIAFTP